MEFPAAVHDADRAIVIFEAAVGVDSAQKQRREIAHVRDFGAKRIEQSLQAVERHGDRLDRLRNPARESHRAARW